MLECGGGRTTHQLFGNQNSHSSFQGIPESRNAATISESGHILLQMGNTPAVAYVNRRAGTWSTLLSLLALELWSFPLTKGSWVTSHHLPGVFNVEADTALKEFSIHT